MNIRPSPSTLFITALPPQQVVGGAGTATRSMLEVLQRAPINARVEVEPIRRRMPRIPHRIRQGTALLRSIVSKLSSKSLFDLPSGSLRRLRHRVSSGRYDLIVINGGQLFFLARYLPPDTPALGIAHNVESMLYADQTASLRTRTFVGPFFAHDLRKLKEGEREGLRRLGRVVCLSSEDAVALAEIEPNIRTLSHPTTFSYPPYRRETNRKVERPLKLGFLAKYSWWPNVEAVQWLIERVLPGLSAGMAEVHLYGPGAERFTNCHPAIIIQGYVPDLITVWQQSDIIICPMLSGSGINIKFIEAIYNGVPVLATTHTKRGIPPFSDESVVYLDGAEEWAAFLGGEAAMRLARSKPDENTCSIFGDKGAAAQLNAFLANDDVLSIKRL